MFVRPLAAMAEDRVELKQPRIVEDFAREALDENAIDAIVAHPLEVTNDGLVIEGAVDFGGLAVGQLERRGIAFIGLEFADIGPKIDVRAARPEAISPGPMVPATAKAVPFSRVPALVTAQDLALEGFGVNAFVALSREGFHGPFDNLLASKRVRFLGLAERLGE